MQHEFYKLAIETKGNHLSVRADGVRNRATVIAITVEISNAALTNHMSKVLVDVRGLEGRLGIMDGYVIVIEAFEKLRGKGLQKVAVVDKPVSPLRGWFLDTMARNRQFNFRVFTGTEEALKWFEL